MFSSKLFRGTGRWSPPVRRTSASIGAARDGRGSRLGRAWGEAQAARLG